VGVMFALQDKIIPTCYYLKYIIRDPSIVTDTCRLCGSSETIQHVIAWCPKLAQNTYKHQHNKVTKIFHQELAKKTRSSWGTTFAIFMFIVFDVNTSLNSVRCRGVSTKTLTS
jgi:hypothetical protein